MSQIFRSMRRLPWLAGLCGILLLVLPAGNDAQAAEVQPKSSPNGKIIPAPSASSAPRPGFWKQNDSTQGNPALTAEQIS